MVSLYLTIHLTILYGGLTLKVADTFVTRHPYGYKCKRGKTIISMEKLFSVNKKMLNNLLYSGTVTTYCF